MGLGASVLISNPMLISLLYVKVNKVIIATLMISISHRCNSLGVLLWELGKKGKKSLCDNKNGRLTNLSPNLHHVQKNHANEQGSHLEDTAFG